MSYLTVDHVAAVATIANLTTLTCRDLRLVVVGALVEDVVVAGNILVSEIEEKGGVQRNAAQTCFKMKMRTRASACIAA